MNLSSPLTLCSFTHLTCLPSGPFLFPLGRVHILEDRSLKLDDVTLEDMGEYSCEADNAVGSITATGILTVHGKLIAPLPPQFSPLLNSSIYFYSPAQVHHTPQESVSGDRR